MADRETEQVTLWVKYAALHLRGIARLVGPTTSGDRAVLPTGATDVLWWLEDRARESVALGMDRWAFRG